MNIGTISVLAFLGKLAELGVKWVLDITKLKLRRNGLSILPESIGNLTNLSYLYLGVNQLTREERTRLKDIFDKIVQF